MEVSAYVKIEANHPPWYLDSTLDPTDAEQDRYEHEIKTETQELLDKLQEHHERPTGSTFLDRYRVEWDTNIQHTEGSSDEKCECGMWHPEGSVDKVDDEPGSCFLQP